VAFCGTHVLAEGYYVDGRSAEIWKEVSLEIRRDIEIGSRKSMKIRIDIGNSREMSVTSRTLDETGISTKYSIIRKESRMPGT
jgi:hypothetical protein